MNSVVITGASTGIGYATVQYCINNGISVFGSVRQSADAIRLQSDFGPLFTPLLFDVCDEDRVHQAAEEVRKSLQGKKLTALINNAGIVVPGPLIYLPIQAFRKQLEVNLIGQLIVTQAFIPLLGTDESLTGMPGKIINISSVAGKRTVPLLAAYAISKHGLEAFSEGLRRELMMFGIDVITVGPGAVKTPIWFKAEESVSHCFSSTVYQPALENLQQLIKLAEKNGLPVEDIAKLIVRIIMNPHAKTRYAPVPAKLTEWVASLLPDRWLDKIFVKKMGLTRNPKFKA